MSDLLSFCSKALDTDPLTLALCCILVMSIGLVAVAWRLSK